MILFERVEIDLKSSNLSSIHSRYSGALLLQLRVHLRQKQNTSYFTLRWQ